MKITLVEERDGEQFSEQTFEREILRIGRDTTECQIIFDTKEFPMVSRRHAELRRHDSQWILQDMNSTRGTFVDGRKIDSTQAVEVGNRLQFGTHGPVMRVVRFEENAPPKATRNFVQNTQARVSAGNGKNKFSKVAVPQFVENPVEQARSSGKQLPQLEFLGEDSPTIPFKITKDSIWLGRDANCDVVFDSSDKMVSRKHAEIRQSNGVMTIYDNSSFNGTLINEQRITVPTPLYHEDQIQLGLSGPVLRLNAPAQIAPQDLSLAGRHSIAAEQSIATIYKPIEINSEKIMPGTMVANPDGISKNLAAQPQFLMMLTFGDKQELIIGRADSSDIKLDGLQISNRHARLLKTGAGIAVEDLNSTNGVFINGNRISRQIITISDSVQIGSFLIRVNEAGPIGVFDTRSKTRIDVLNITKNVKNRSGNGTVRLLDDVSLSIQPNEFVGLLGPSGAGKSTLMDAMNGMRPASSGAILVNNLDLYQHLDSLKQSIGYVPQDDIIHRELTVFRTLYYVAKLRLSSDVSSAEVDKIIDEVLDVTGLTERRDVPVNQLSGGQRKRVSIAVELITKPSVIFLDEPTSGLDPATEEKIMKLFREIAESGRTIILTTHAMENVRLFDKIVVMMRGKLVFYGKPDEALAHLGAANFKELYDKLEEPIEEKLKQNGGGNLQQITEQVAEEWKQKFIKTSQYKKNVYEPLINIGNPPSDNTKKKNRLGLFGSFRQCATLSRRYAEVLLRDKLNLFILFAQAPIIALLTYFVMGENQTRDFAYFVLSLVAVWFGTAVAAREIIRERPVYDRERMVNVGLIPYLFSKLFVLGVIVGIQCFLLFVPLKVLDISGLMPMPGEMFGIPQLWVMLLTAFVGIAMGLLISAQVKTSELATSLVPLILIPQILFSGLIGVPSGVNKTVGLMMPAAWAFDTMKRFSTLDTLEEEGADANSEIGGRGYYKFVETENNKVIEDSKRNIDDYKRDAVRKIDDFEADLKAGKNPSKPELADPPKPGDAKRIDKKEMSSYVSFLHPWMNKGLNQLVLTLMLCILIIATLIVLRKQDVG